MSRLPILSCCILLALVASCGNAPATREQEANNPASNAVAVNTQSPSADTPPHEKASMDYLREGTAAYVAHDFNRAIPPLQKALDLEKQKRTLDKKFWLVLVDNLAMAHGMTGDIKGSLTVLEYGISQEPTYPMFYYNTACGYGETGDEAEAIKNLRLAFKFKANMIAGEPFPDPATDNSFHNFANSDTFKNALAELKGVK